MSVVVSNIVIEQGAVFSMTVDVLDSANNPLVVTGYSACAQLRKTWSSIAQTDFTTALVNGMLTVSLSANATSAMAPGRYMYDAKIYNNSINAAVRLVEGMATVSPAIAR